MEYAGYKGIDSIVDYAGLTDKLATKISDIGQERTKTKQELDQLAADTSKKFSEMEMTKTESLNDKILALGDEGREKVNGWNAELKAGRLSPSQYKKNMAGLSEYTSLVGSTAKTFDARIQEYIKRQEDKKGSAFELETLDRFGMMANLKNTDYRVLEDGRIAIDIKDPKTGKVIRQEDLRAINKPENMTTPRMDLTKEVNSVVKNWAADGIVKMLGQGGYENSESAMNDPQYKLDKQRLVDSLVEQNAISLLVDNGGLTAVNYAYSDEDKKAKLSEIIAKEKEVRKRAGQSTELTADELADLETGIIIIDNDGKPQLTEEQIEKARKIADAEIDLQVGSELKVVAPQNWYGNARNSNNYNTTQKRLANAEGYKLTLDVMNAKVGDTAETNTNIALLMDKAKINGTPMVFEKVKVGNEYYLQGKPITEDEDGNIVYGNPIPFKTAASLAPFVFGGNTDEALAQHRDGADSDIGKAYSAKIQGQWNSNKAKDKPKNTTQNNDPLGLGL